MIIIITCARKLKYKKTQQQQQQLCVERTYSTRRNDLQQQQFGTDEKIPTPVASYKI